jgi:dynamin 1-like protein
MSPAVRENGTSSITGTMNGLRSGSPPRFTGQGAGGARDSFLNYFFGKDGGLPAGNSTVGQPVSATNPNLGRHVSQSTEPSFSQSIRRQEERQHRPNIPSLREDDYSGRGGREYDYNSPFVSSKIYDYQESVH